MKRYYSNDSSVGGSLRPNLFLSREPRLPSHLITSTSALHASTTDRRLHQKLLYIKINTQFGARKWRSSKYRKCDTYRSSEKSGLHHRVRVTMHEVLFAVLACTKVARFEFYSTVSQAGSVSPKDSPVDLQKMRIHLDGLGQGRDDLLKLQVGPLRAKLQALQTLRVYIGRTWYCRRII